eukprot:TRINITY_DN1550_c0_g1_i1.p1 TRINITY_DN1550_c0_g1~~TRINITY_DN1550_c0_g1_i1.p1  ORF type:complete len:1405 (+),score=203.13 TRINITY_DN1550_c0_g1_i1:318-4532(+)
MKEFKAGSLQRVAKLACLSSCSMASVRKSLCFLIREYDSFYTLTLVLLVVLSATCKSATGVAINAQDYATLVEVKEAFQPYKDTLASWNESLLCEGWAGLACDSEGYVTDIYLSDLGNYLINLTLLDEGAGVYSTYFYEENTTAPFPNYYIYEYIGDAKYFGPLNGSLSPFLGNLSRLETLSVIGENIQGPIPAELGKLSKLKLLNLSNNGLSGAIPASLGNLSELIALDLASNGRVVKSNDPFEKRLATAINGPIPTEIGKCTKLEYLNLNHNNLSGPVPSSLAKLTNLKVLILQGNFFYTGLTGNLSSSDWISGSFTQLEILDLSGNSFTGSLPTSIDKSPDLVYMDMSQNLFSGALPEELGKLTKLRQLNLQGNKFTSLPESVGNLSSLIRLNVGDNDLKVLPSSLANLKSLQFLDAVGCGLVGSFPDLSLFTQLVELELSFNYLNTKGGIPVYFSSFVNLTFLDLSSNDFQGGFPSHLLKLPLLDTFACNHCNLTGLLPSNIGDFKSMKELDLTDNKFTGPIPESIGNLANLINLMLSNNKMNGTLPASLGSLSLLEELNLDGNAFEGTIPASFGQLAGLAHLDLHGNMLTEIPDSLVGLQNIQELDLSFNNFTTPLPDFIGTFSQLANLSLSFNAWGGSIPIAFTDFNETLKAFACRSCGLSGSLPEALQLYSQLEFLDLGDNNFIGSLNGSFFDQFTLMKSLCLSGSSLISSIPPLDAMTGLLSLDLSQNNFQGPLPDAFPPSLVALNLSYNLLTGNLSTNNPFEPLASLQTLFLEGNDFTGPVPNVFSPHSSELTFVSLAGNGLTGAIPARFGNVSADLSGNPACTEVSSSRSYCFAGSFNPQHFLRDLTRFPACPSAVSCYWHQNFLHPTLCQCAAPVYANFTVYPAVVQYYTDFVGQSLTQYFARETDIEMSQIVVASAITNSDSSLSFGVLVFGPTLSPPPPQYLVRLNRANANIPDLGSRLGPYTALFAASLILPPPPPPNTPPPPPGTSSSGTGLTKTEIALTAAGGALLVLICLGALLAFYLCSRVKVLSSFERRIQQNQVRTMSMKEIHLATNNFDPKFVLGEGGYGVVYKGHSAQGEPWAIKRAKVITDKGGEFDTEVEMISQLHHTNLVALIGFHASKHEQILVYEFMPLGTVQDHLSEKKREKGGNEPLPFETRVSIALGAAEGIRYLHNFTKPPYIHRDIKTANILLDENYVAKVADFGLLRANQQGEDQQKISIVGTPGYMDPEYYSTRQVSTKSDVFSFGVVLLELVTGRTPVLRETDASGEISATSLASWVQPYYDQHTAIIDPLLGREYHPDAMRLFVRLAFNCVERAARHRPTMDDCARRLLAIRNLSQGLPNSDSLQDNVSVSGTGGEHYDNELLGMLERSTSLSRTNDIAPMSTVFGSR